MSSILEKDMRMSEPPKIFIDRLENNYLTQIRKGLSYIKVASKIKAGNTVFIKPNLTSPSVKKTNGAATVGLQLVL